MARAKIKWRRAAFREMRTSAPVRAMVQESVDAIANACGEGYEAEVRDGRTRVHGSVATADFAAMTDNARNNTLLKNIEAGRQ